MLKMILFPHSSNAKTGDIIQSYSSRITCPNTCVFKKNGCYGDNYHTAMQWKRADDAHDKRYVSTVNDLMASLVSAVADHAKESDTILFRHNVAGDIAKEDSSDIDENRVEALVLASFTAGCVATSLNAKFYGYTYTHCKQSDRNNAIIRDSIGSGFVINYSCESVAEVVNAHNNGIPSVITSVNPEETIEALKAQGIKALQCPSQTKGISCKRCMLCALKTHQPIVFTVHGMSSKKARKVIMLKNASSL